LTYLHVHLGPPAGAGALAGLKTGLFENDPELADSVDFPPKTVVAAELPKENVEESDLAAAPDPKAKPVVETAADFEAAGDAKLNKAGGVSVLSAEDPFFGGGGGDDFLAKKSKAPPAEGVFASESAAAGALNPPNPAKILGAPS
jgi:hypothetical protein